MMYTIIIVFSKGEIIGDSFISYRTGENDYELIITKKENDNNVKYTLSKNGKQTKAKGYRSNC